MKYILILCFSILVSQNYQDARMLGLGGAYCTLANGYRAVGVNPANINNGTNSTINIFSSKSLIMNNFYPLTINISTSSTQVSVRDRSYFY